MNTYSALAVAATLLVTSLAMAGSISTTIISTEPLAVPTSDDGPSLVKDESMIPAQKAGEERMRGDHGIGIQSAGCDLGSGTHTLTEGVSVAANMASSGSYCDFVFTPAAGSTSARFTVTQAASNDLDVYAKAGSIPGPGNYDCWAWNTAGTTIVCTIPHLGQDAYAAVWWGFWANAGAISIVAESITPPPTCSLGAGIHPLSEGATVTAALTSDPGAVCYFEFDPSPGSDIGRIVMDPDTSDFDLYVKAGAVPTTGNWDCRPFFGGNAAETCEILNDGSTLYIMVLLYLGSGDFDITATSETVPELMPGVPTIVSVTPGSTQLWKVVAPAGSSHVSVALAGEPDDMGLLGLTDADLYVMHEAIPAPFFTFDCRPWVYGSIETCTFDDLLFAELGTDPTGTGITRIHPSQGDGRYFVLVHGFSGTGDVALVAAVV